MTQREIHGYDGSDYRGVFVATDEEFTETGYTEGVAPAYVVTDAMVEEERDRRVLVGFGYMGANFHMDAGSRANVLATFAAAMDRREHHRKEIKLLNILITDSALEIAVLGVSDWAQTGSNFKFGAKSGVNVEMTLGETLDFGRAAKVFYETLIFAARNLKQTPGGIPEDYADDAYWP